MAETLGTRKSGRARKAAQTYADEQADEQPVGSVAPPKRKKSKGAKGAKDAPQNVAADDTSTKPESADADEPEPPRKKSKKAAAQAANGPATDTEPQQVDEEFKPAPKKARKKKRAAAIGKLDSEGVMRLDVSDKRPPGEKKPPRVYEIPAKSTALKGGPSINLAAILAESFEDRWERKVAKIPRLAPGAQEVRLKE